MHTSRQFFIGSLVHFRTTSALVCPTPMRTIVRVFKSGSSLSIWEVGWSPHHALRSSYIKNVIADSHQTALYVAGTLYLEL